MALDTDFYPGDYLRPRATGNLLPAKRRPLRVVVIPELGGDGDYSPCAYIRLLLPLDYLRDLGLIHLTIASRHRALKEKADLLFCQRTSNCNAGEAQAIVDHARAAGMPLFYDLDDNLLEIEPSHPEHEILARNAATVRTFLDGADAILLSTENLRRQIAPSATHAFVLPNAIDHRMISPPAGTPRHGRVGILYMGTQTHNDDFELVSGALSRVATEFGKRVRLGIIGVTTSARLPQGISRVEVPSSVGTSYPAFMSWLTGQTAWQIGLSPLRETRFNAAKSAIKALDYMAMGALSLVSRVPAYEGLPDEVVRKVRNTPAEWYDAIAACLQDEERLIATGVRARAVLMQSYTLEAQLGDRLGILNRALRHFEGSGTS